jgi:DNA repair exonuclease SbcCD nuclease subunit
VARPDAAADPWTRSAAARWTAVERMAEAARAHQVLFVVIAGDLFHAPGERAGAALKDLTRILGGLTPIPVFIVHANHDPGDARSWGIDLPGNITVFPCDRVGIAEVRDPGGELLARILGRSYRRQFEPDPLHVDYVPPDRSVFNIGVLHTDLKSAGSTDAPCTVSQLIENEEIDYWALGHEHAAIRKDGGGERAVVYSGMLQGGDSGGGECGLHGALIVDLAEHREPVIRLAPTSTYIWADRTVLIDPLADRADANETDVGRLILADAAALADAAQQAAFPCLAPPRIEGHHVKWTIAGRAPVHHLLDRYRDDAAEETIDPEQFLELNVRDRLAARFTSPPVTAVGVEIKTAAPRPPLDELCCDSERGRIFARIRHIAVALEREPQAALCALTELFTTDPEKSDDYEGADAGSLFIDPETATAIVRDALEEAVDALRDELESAP